MDLQMAKRIFTRDLLAIFIFIYTIQAYTACTLDQGFQVTSVCQDMRCEGRYVALTSAGLPSNANVTCLCVVALRLAPSALLRYQSPGYPFCGIYYDWNQLRFSCRDGAETLTETFSQVMFHKTMTTSNPESLFQLSIDQQHPDGSLAVRCYPPDSSTATTDPPLSLTSTTTLQPTSPTASLSSTSRVENVTTESTTKLTVTKKPSTGFMTISTSTYLSTQNATVDLTLSSSTTKSFTRVTSLFSILSTSSQTVAHSSSITITDSATTTDGNVTTPSATMLSTVVSSPSSNGTMDNMNANDTAEVTSYDLNKKVLLLSIAGGASGLFVLVLTVIIVAAIRRRRMKKQALNSSQTSYIHAFDDPAEEPVNISSVFQPPDHTLADTSLPQVESSYPPSFHTISSGTLTLNYHWGSNDELEDDADLFVETGYPWEGCVDETDKGQLDEGRIDSDIYAIVTRKGADVKVERHSSPLMTFQHK